MASWRIYCKLLTVNPKAWGKLNSQELHITILHNAAKTYLNTINETLAYKCCGPVSSLDHSWLQWVHFDRCIHMWTLPEPDWAHREPEGQSPALLENIKKWKIVFCQGFFSFSDLWNIVQSHDPQRMKHCNCEVGIFPGRETDSFNFVSGRPSGVWHCPLWRSLTNKGATKTSSSIQTFDGLSWNMG